MCRKAPCRAYLDRLSFCRKIGDAMCIPEMSFFLVAVKDGNGTMRFCGVLWPIVCFVVAHCNLFHISIVMLNITMSRGEEGAVSVNYRQEDDLTSGATAKVAQEASTPRPPPSPLRTLLRLKRVGQRSSRAARY